MQTALVTGASGMLGAYIVEELVRNGWRVRALVRTPDRAEWLRTVGAECVAGDLRDAASLAHAAHRCDSVFHTAAEIGPRGNDDRYRTGNVLGTRNVVDAAARAGARLIHISSTAVYSRETRLHHRPVTESVLLGALTDDDGYGTTKLGAEVEVLSAVERGTLWATIVRPPPMYGVRDRQFVPRLAPVLARGAFPIIGGGRAVLTAVHAGSVAQGAFLAGTNDAARGRVYNLTNDVPVSVDDFMRLAAEGLGIRVFRPRIPHAVGAFAGAVLKGALIASGRRSLTPHVDGFLTMLTSDNPFSSERARTELGWHPAPRPEVVIPEAFRWWKEHVYHNSAAHGSANATT